MCIKILSQGSYLWNKLKGPSVASKKQIAGDLTTQYWKKIILRPSVLYLLFSA